jgi:hypothetical protein
LSFETVSTCCCCCWKGRRTFSLISCSYRRMISFLFHFHNRRFYDMPPLPTRLKTTRSIRFLLPVWPAL